MSKSFIIITIIALIVIVCLGLVILETRTKVFHHAYDNFILDNKNHYLPCDKLPTEVEANQVVQEHQNIIEAIKKVNSGLIGIEIDTTTCPGKDDILIWYGSHTDRIQIEKIIGGDTFFGIPYRLNNR